MKIKLQLLRQAQALTAHGSFSRAAAALNLSQPALSRGIKELEEQVGLQLFLRSRSGLELSDFGRVFMQRAAELVLGAEDLEREVALARGLATGEIAVGAGPYVMATLAPVCVPAFAAAHNAGNRSVNPLASVWVPKPNDGPVSVANSHLAGETAHHTVPASHTGILFHSATARATSTFLRTGRFD